MGTKDATSNSIKGDSGVQGFQGTLRERKVKLELQVFKVSKLSKE